MLETFFGIVFSNEIIIIDPNVIETQEFDETTLENGRVLYLEKMFTIFNVEADEIL